MPRIPVYRMNEDVAFRFVTPNVAIRLVATGLAQPSGERSLLLKPDVDRRVKRFAKSQQKWAYLALGIEKHPRFATGGLTRTETNPRKGDRFSGARVGHQ